MSYELKEAGQQVPERILTEKMKIATLAHFVSGVPIERLALNDSRKNLLARVEHVYWLKVKNPFLDSHAMFYEMAKAERKDPANAHHLAKAEDRVLEFVIENARPASRKDSEMKVRAASDKLIRIGLETDNVQALHKGADLRMRLDRLDQPESERADMNRVAFMPTVVVTDIREVDDTKENIDDEETKRIIAKYGAYVDDKHKAIEDKVAQMEARSSAGNISADNME